MTIHLNVYFLCYWAVSIIPTSIYIYLGYKDLKKKLHLSLMVEYLTQSIPFQILKRRVLSPSGYIFLFVIIVVSSPLEFPVVIISGIKKLFGYKSPQDKKEDAYVNKMQPPLEDSENKSEGKTDAEIQKMGSRLVGHFVHVDDDDTENSAIAIAPLEEKKEVSDEVADKQLGLLTENHAGCMKVKGVKDAINYKVVRRIENNSLVYYTPAGIENLFPPFNPEEFFAIRHAKTIEANRLKDLKESELIALGFIAIVSLDDIELVHF